MITSAGFSLAAFHTRQLIPAMTVKANPIKIRMNGNGLILTCRT
ncbi:hypothetical protein ACJEEQ_02675 [Phocaeicola vulgatus]